MALQPYFINTAKLRLSQACEPYSSRFFFTNMHGSKAAKDTDESEYSGRRKTLLPRLASSKDWRQWAFKTETILKQKELWYVIENAAPAREVRGRRASAIRLGLRR